MKWKNKTKAHSYLVWAFIRLTQIPIAIGTQQELNYFLECFFKIHFRSNDTVKLTIAPMEAKRIVFTISSE